MANILISGLINTETSVSVRQFPIPYYPIDYPFFGVKTVVSGVAYNIAKAMKTLGDSVRLASMTGSDFQAEYILKELQTLRIDTAHIRQVLSETASSAVLYDPEGDRQIYCDLKDIQERSYGFSADILDGIDLVVACNINFNRELLHLAGQAGIPIATDVHVLTDLYDSYNREFLTCADIIFLSDEGIGCDYRGFLYSLARNYGAKVIVLGRGSKGAAIYCRESDVITELPAVYTGPVVNTVGAGDALFSAFLHFYCKGLDPVSCLCKAQYFASAKIRVSGASQGFVSEAELESLVNK